MFQFNKSHCNKTVEKNVAKAMFNVNKGYSVDHVRNKNGDAYLAVRREGDKFLVTNSRNKNVAACFTGSFFTNNLVQGV